MQPDTTFAGITPSSGVFSPNQSRPTSRYRRGLSSCMVASGIARPSTHAGCGRLPCSMTTLPRSVFPLLCGLLACLSWSVGDVLAKVALSRLEPLTLLTGQLAASAFGLSALSICLGMPVRLSDWRVGLPGVLQPALAYGLSTFGLAMLPATAEAMLFSVETPTVMLLAWSILGERTTRSMGALCLLTLTGVVLLSWNSEADPYSLQGVGVALVLGAVFFASLYNIAVRRMSRSVDALRLARASQFVALLVVGLAWVLGSGSLAGSLTIGDAALIVTSGLLLQAIPFLLFGITLERMNVAAAALLLPLVPMFTAVLAAFFLEEVLSLRQWLGAGIILASAVATPLVLRSAP